MEDSVSKVMEAVRNRKVVAIVRGFDAEVCLKLAEAYISSGIGLMEVTFDQSRPDGLERSAKAIEALSRRFGDDLLVGAGTVLTEAQVLMARDAGAKYAIAPNVDTKVIAAAVANGLVAMPGAMTPSEIVTAYNAGAGVIKVFPASLLGPAFIKAVKAPLPHIPLMAVGGMSAANAADFINAGCVGIGVGGSLVNKEWIAAGEWGKIAQAAADIVAAVRGRFLQNPGRDEARPFQVP